MNARFWSRILTLFAVIPLWASATPAHAQGRGGFGGLGGLGRSGGGGAANFANQFLRGVTPGYTPQPSYYPGMPSRGGVGPQGPGNLQGTRPPNPSFRIGGSSLGGLQNQPRGGGVPSPYINPSNLGGVGRGAGMGMGPSPVSNFNSGGLSGAFGQQPPQTQSAYQTPYRDREYEPQPSTSGGGPVAGQPYQIPAEHADKAPGTIITWGRHRYLLGSDGTMTLYTGPALASTTTNAAASPSTRGPNPGQRYQIPADYAETPPGTEINYGGNRYLANNDGTMTALSASNESGDAAVERTSTGPVPGKRYQIPADQANADPGSEISYGGHGYIVNNDGTMTALRSSDPADGSDADAKPAGPVLGKRYQIPAEHVNTAPGSLITYGGNSYVANDDGTMTAFKTPQ